MSAQTGGRGQTGVTRDADRVGDRVTRENEDMETLTCIRGAQLEVELGVLAAIINVTCGRNMAKSPNSRHMDERVSNDLAKGLQRLNFR